MPMTGASACRACGGKLFGDDIYCPACGTRRPEEELASGQTMGATRVFVPRAADGGNIALCPSCHAPHHADAKFCTQCGRSVVVEQAKQPGDGWPEVRKQLEQATSGEFEILRELGRGGMAAVYIARDLSLGRNVAIKVMAPGLLMGEGMVARFRQEAITVANLRHPNIITIHGVKQAANLHFFIMQLVEGGSLEDVIKRTGPLPIPLVQVILYQVGTALHHAHGHEIVHRDVKPANVLIDGDGSIILTDFGIAKAAASTHLTQTGSTLGTPTYMSPEQCLARELSGASDQYSLGVMAYEMLVGHPPYGGSAFEIMQSHTLGTVAPFRTVRPDCPEEIEQAVLRMVARDPAQRFPSVAEAVEAIGGYMPGPRDPLRAEIARLVKPDAQAAPDSWKSMTPLPSGRTTPLPFTSGQHPSAPTATGAGQAVAAPRRRTGLIAGVAAAGVVVVALGIFTALKLRDRQPGAAGTPAATVIPAQITFASPAESLMVKGTATVRAQLHDSAGQDITGQPVTWNSLDSAVATVTGTGGEAVLTAVGPGVTTVEAAVGDVKGALRVVVYAPPPGALLVSAPASELQVGEELPLTVEDPAGGAPAAGTIKWTSSDPRVVAVDAARGVATARGVGRARLTATANGKTGNIPLRVLGEVQAVAITPPAAALQVGGTVVLRSTVTAQPPGYQGARGLMWSSSAPDIATVTSARGDSAVVALLKEGEATLTAAADEKRGTVVLRVRPGAAAVTVSLSPASVALELTEGAAASSERTVRIAVTGGADPFLGVVRYDGGARDWLRTSLAESGLTLRAAGSGLQAGTYSARVPVGAGSAREELTVNLTVNARPVSTAVEPSAAAEREIGALISAYVSAINTKNEARVRELYPGITAAALRDLLRIQTSQIFQVMPLPGTLRAGRTDKTLDIDVTAGILSSGKGQTNRVIYTIGRNASGWIIVGSRASR
ncbi:MAG: hypothetical protein FIB01_06730 [Gemmatimonadetes bacterium]|nr:hypothetical protein [Gemmatimonadota bacterium]